MKMIKKGLTYGLGAVLMSTSFAFSQSIDDVKKAINDEQFAKAEGMLKQIKNSKPKDGEAYFYLGQVYLRNEYLDSAKAVFQAGIAADPKSSLSYVGTGQSKLQAGDATGAKADFDAAIKVAKRKDFTPYLFIGKAYLAQKNPDFAAAEVALKKAYELGPKSGEVLVGLGDLYSQQKNNSEATNYYYQALDIDQASFLRASTQLGVMYKQARSFDAAKGKLDEAVEKDATYAPAYRELSELYLQWGSFNAGSDTTSEKSRQAIDYYKKYLDLTDKSFDSQNRFAKILFYGRDFKELQTVAQNLIAQRPEDVVANRMAGIAAAENNDGATSLTFMNKVFDLAKGTDKIVPSDYLYLGKAQLAAGQDDQAYDNIKKAAQSDSTLAPNLADVAKKYFTNKNYAKSAEVFNEAINADKNAPGVLYDYYYIANARYYQVATDTVLAKQPQAKDLLKDGESAISKVIELAPTTVDAYFLKGNIQAMMDDRDNPTGLFLDAYNKYIELSTAPGKTPNNNNLSFAYSNLAAYYLTHDKTKAVETLKKSLELNPNDEWAKFHLDELTNPAPAAKAAVKKVIKGKK